MAKAVTFALHPEHPLGIVDESAPWILGVTCWGPVDCDVR